MHWLPIVFIVIGFLGVFAGAGMVVTGMASRHWPHVEGEVLLAKPDYKLVERSGVTSTDYFPVVEYRYNVRGRDYRGREINVKGHGTTLAEVQEIVAKYPMGSKVNVYYHPARPEESLLEPGASFGTVIVLVVSIAFIVIAVLAILREQ